MLNFCSFFNTRVITIGKDGLSNENKALLRDAVGSLHGDAFIAMLEQRKIDLNEKLLNVKQQDHDLVLERIDEVQDIIYQLQNYAENTQ